MSWMFYYAGRRDRETAGPAEAMRELGVREGLILTCDEEGEFKRNGLSMRVRPAWRWMLEDGPRA